MEILMDVSASEKDTSSSSSSASNTTTHSEMNHEEIGKTDGRDAIEKQKGPYNSTETSPKCTTKPANKRIYESIYRETTAFRIKTTWRSYSSANRTLL